MTESELLYNLQLEAKELMYIDWDEFGGFKPTDEISDDTLIFMQILLDRIISKREEKMKEQDAIYYERKSF